MPTYSQSILAKSLAPAARPKVEEALNEAAKKEDHHELRVLDPDLKTILRVPWLQAVRIQPVPWKLEVTRRFSAGAVGLMAEQVGIFMVPPPHGLDALPVGEASPSRL